MGLLKSLGFVRRQIALSVSWQTTTVAAIGIVLGVPLGIAAGRLVWDAFASNLGVVADPVVTAWVVAAIAAGDTGGGEPPGGRAGTGGVAHQGGVLAQGRMRVRRRGT